MRVKNILVAGNYEEEFKKMDSNCSREYRFLHADEIADSDLSWADVYVGSKPCANFNLAKVKWVHSFNAGVNNYLEIDGWEKYNVLLTRTVCSFGERISEYCLSYILRDLQYHEEFLFCQKEKKWMPKTPKMIKDQTFLIYGTGEIGQVVGKTLSEFGATVFGVSKSGKQKQNFKEVFDISSASSLICKADWIISTLPLTHDTIRIFDTHFFENMNGSVFINVGRGATVDEVALLSSLESGKVRHAILDVLSEEPLPENSTLWGRKDVIITPHISAITQKNEAVECFFDTLWKLENNEPIPNKVDFSKGY
ncbi:D-2-hydroxyacid dehydrogenase [Bacillus salitolerans]|uniref:D-2-hydroxyacid dehydrogenase n=1 Tax=Bacillus salitolerans TaxID=1437434 RepID=A0ABW4LQI4_9BACI